MSLLNSQRLRPLVQHVEVATYAKSLLRILPVSSRATPSSSNTFIPVVAAKNERPLHRQISFSEVTGRSRSVVCTRRAEPAARPLP